MSNTQAMCNSFKTEVLTGVHVLGTDTLKCALFLASATTNKSTTAYGATGEVSGTGYSAGGVTVTTANAPSLDGDAAVFTPSANIVFTTVTLTTSFDCALIYNSSKSNKAVSVHTFGAQTITAGTLTLTMPADTAGNALIQLS